MRRFLPAAEVVVVVEVVRAREGSGGGALPFCFLEAGMRDVVDEGMCGGCLEDDARP
jgi:hypothetical protein